MAANPLTPKLNLDRPDPNPKNKNDFLTHIEIYLSKRDGVDKLLKISRYATKIILASSSVIAHDHPFLSRLKSFESSVGVSRKAFRLGKFVQDVNALREIDPGSRSYSYILLSVIAYGGEGLYYFVEQLVWLGKAGWIDKSSLPKLQMWSAWCELVGYFGSVNLKVMELRKIGEDEVRLASSIDGENLNGAELAKLETLRQKKRMKKLSVIQDLADALMALADVRDGGGLLSAPLLISSAGLLSAVISTHKNWVSC